MSRDKKLARSAAKFLRICKHPCGCARYIVNLFAPGDSWLQTIVDHRDADPLRGIKTSDVAVNIITAYAQAFVAGIQSPSMNENHHWPIAAGRNEKIEPMFLISRAWMVLNVSKNLPFRQGGRSIEKSHGS